MKYIYFSFLIIALAISPVSYAAAKDKINNKSIEDAGFKSVSEILKKMSPEQLQQVIDEAEKLMPEVQAMNPKQLDDFTNRLLQVDNSIDVNSVDVKNIDPATAKGLKSVEQDIEEYIKQNGKK